MRCWSMQMVHLVSEKDSLLFHEISYSGTVSDKRQVSWKRERTSLIDLKRTRSVIEIRKCSIVRTDAVKIRQRRNYICKKAPILFVLK